MAWANNSNPWFLNFMKVAGVLRLLLCLNSGYWMTSETDVGFLPKGTRIISNNPTKQCISVFTSRLEFIIMCSLYSFMNIYSTMISSKHCKMNGLNLCTHWDTERILVMYTILKTSEAWEILQGTADFHMYIVIAKYKDDFPLHKHGSLSTSHRVQLLYSTIRMVLYLKRCPLTILFHLRGTNIARTCS